MNDNEQTRRSVNAAPLDDFDGFSPDEMNTIIYSPFAEECAVRIRPQIDNQVLDQSPIFQIVRHILKATNDTGGLKLTSTGNIAPALVKEIYARKYIVDPMIELGITKLNQEIKWKVLHCTKIVLKMSKLIRTYKGKLLLPKRTKKCLMNGEYFELFHIFLNTFTTQFNWAYNDSSEDEEIGQVGFLYLLHLINKYGAEFRELSFYSDLYFKAFPIFKASKNSLFPIRNDFVIAIRFFDRFAEWFGFVEIHREQNRVTGPARVRRTKLLSCLLL